MNEHEYLTAELRAVREELARRDIDTHHTMGVVGSLLFPSRDDRFIRLSQLSDDALEAHEERLMSDLNDLTDGFAAALDAEGETDHSEQTFE